LPKDNVGAELVLVFAARNMIRHSIFLRLALCFCRVLWPQDKIKPDNPARLESLQREVRQLQEPVSGLQAQLAAQPVSAPPASLESATVGLTDSSATRARPHITFRGFGEVNYQALDQRQPEIAGGGFVPGSAGNFYAGNFDLLLTAPISSRVNVLSEINFQETDVQHFEVDVERLLLNYDYKDWLRVSAGRYQTAIGYYNTVFMSGAWPQTMANRQRRGYAGASHWSVSQSRRSFG